MVGRMLAQLVNRVFRSRWGIAAVLAMVVFGVIGFGRFVSGGKSDEPLLTRPNPAPVISTDPKQDDSAIVASEPPPTIRAVPGTAAPAAVAFAFASAWVDHRGVSARKWYEGLRPHITENLAADLEGVDPQSVPADKISGRPELEAVGDGLADATVTADTGTLTLRLVGPDGHWLVDGIDWDPS